MRIKIIIHSGIVTEVLADGPAEVGIIDIDKDYGDYNVLCARGGLGRQGIETC